MLSGELLQQVPGLTYRMLDYWCTRKFVHPVRGGNPGSGEFRTFTCSEVAVVRTMARLTAVGLTPAAAHQAARNGGELAPGVRVSIDEPAA